MHDGLAPTAGSALAAWHGRVAALPSVAQTFREFEAAAAAMASVSSLYVSRERRREYHDDRLEWMVESGGIDVVSAALAVPNVRFSWPAAGRLI